MQVSHELVNLFADLQEGLPQANVSTAGVTVLVAFPQSDVFTFGDNEVKTNALAPLQSMANVIKKYENVNLFVNCLAGNQEKDAPDKISPISVPNKSGYY